VIKDPPLRLPEILPLYRGRGDPLSGALRAMRTPVVVTDPTLTDNPIIFANDAFLGMTGYARHEVIGRNCRFLQGPETSQEAIAQIRNAMRSGQDVDVDVELLNYRKNGEKFWVSLSISTVMNSKGQADYFIATQLDISARIERQAELKRAEAAQLRRTAELEKALEVQQVLVSEIDHRVKNNLQMVSAMLMLQAMTIPDPGVQQTLQEMLERVDALGLVHKRLHELSQRTRFDVADFTREIVDTIIGASGRKDIVVGLHVEPVVISADSAAAVALVVNEALTNALKHGFRSGRGGRLSVRLTVSDGHCLLRIADDGFGLPAEKPVAKTFGTTLIETLAVQLRAVVEWRSADPGTVFLMRFPLAEGTA
jgi:PAS domain S-box-containing protein